MREGAVGERIMAEMACREMDITAALGPSLTAGYQMCSVYGSIGEEGDAVEGSDEEAESPE